MANVHTSVAQLLEFFHAHKRSYLVCKQCAVRVGRGSERKWHVKCDEDDGISLFEHVGAGVPPATPLSKKDFSVHRTRRAAHGAARALRRDRHVASDSEEIDAASTTSERQAAGGGRRRRESASAGEESDGSDGSAQRDASGDEDGDEAGPAGAGSAEGGLASIAADVGLALQTLTEVSTEGWSDTLGTAISTFIGPAGRHAAVRGSLPFQHLLAVLKAPPAVKAAPWTW